MLSRSYLLLILFILSTVCVYVNGQLCLMCENGAAGLVRPHHFLDGHGTTCISKSLEMAADLKTGSGQCRADQNRYSDCCCNRNAQCNSVTQVATAPPVYNGPRGNYPSCDICKGRGRITNTAMVINMLYIGTGTCSQYYDYGLAGLIQTHMCDPLQHYAYEPCGCGEFGNQRLSQAPVNQIGSSSSGSNSNNINNVNNNNNNMNSAIVPPERKNPAAFSGNDSRTKIANNRGGAGAAVRGGGRNLKGAK